MAVIPPAEVRIDAALVSRLLDGQAPHLAEPHVEPFAHGWDNEIFALGPDLLVRLPRREASAGLIDHEIAVLPSLAARLPVPIPVPVFAGRPAHGFPWRWTVVPRLPGHSAADTAVADRGAAADGLARFLVALHTRAPADAPRNPFRGVPLAARAEGWRPRIEAVAGRESFDRWLRWSAVPAWPDAPVWVHGDPHPMNLLLHSDGRLAGVIDFGDVCAGDPASDLAVAWLMFDAPARAAFRAACSLSGAYDEAVWARAWAWALGLACVFTLASDDMPALAAIARHGLAETLADAEFSAAG
ncbi:MAG: aminoglycoside phosphotransferase family protein [Actinobacteria bacterium]|nr:aminoglycoside phosphotransferase family protein [Actinomycetota bacterium]